jgi:hypothetical protein
MAEVDRTIGIGQGAGDEDLAWLGHGARLLDETEVGHYKAPAHIFHPRDRHPRSFVAAAEGCVRRGPRSDEAVANPDTPDYLKHRDVRFTTASPPNAGFASCYR